jgi:hypothetical protein
LYKIFKIRIKLRYFYTHKKKNVKILLMDGCVEGEEPGGAVSEAAQVLRVQRGK